MFLGSSVWNSLIIILLTPTILRWRLNVWPNLYTPCLHILQVCQENFSAARCDRKVSSKISEYKLPVLRALFVETEKILPRKGYITYMTGKLLWNVVSLNSGTNGHKLFLAWLWLSQYLNGKSAFIWWQLIDSTDRSAGRYVTPGILPSKLHILCTYFTTNCTFSSHTSQ